MFSCTFSISGFSFAVFSTIAIPTAVEVLHLELRNKSLCTIVKIVDIAPVCDTFVCYMNVLQIDHDRAMFCFTGEFFVFVLKKSDFGDDSTSEVVDDFEYLSRACR